MQLFVVQLEHDNYFCNNEHVLLVSCSLGVVFVVAGCGVASCEWNVLYLIHP